MDYKKKYNEALERANKYLYDTNKRMSTEFFEATERAMKEIFPELKESEDERIRKSLIKYYSFDKDGGAHALDNITPKQIVAWLEKQGEHANFRNKIQIGDKVTRNEDGLLINLSQLNRVAKKDEKQGESTEINPSEFDLRLNKLLKQFESLPKEDLIGILSFYLNVIQNDGIYKEEKQGEQKPAEWSEEDEKMIQDIINDIAIAQEQVYCKSRCEDEINWLKSLRPQKAWKPSVEQMQALEYFIINHNEHTGYAKDLEELRQNLKKLREE